MSTGFGKDGIKKGSSAANMQSNIGNVEKDSDFAKLQAAGASGQDVGFGKDGVQRSTAAADCQANSGDVEKGSDFAKLQSHGARGGK